MALLTRENLPLPPQAPQSRLEGIPEGAAGIRATLDAMVRLTRQYRTNLTVRRLAEQIIAGIPPKQYWLEVEAVLEWVRHSIRYTQDVYDVEMLRDPESLINEPFGDCDDMALLAGTLLVSLGHPVRYVAVATNDMGEYNHVYVETKVADKWIGIETTENVPLGWIPTPQLSRMVRHV